MKKYMIFLSAIFLCFALSACGNRRAEDDNVTDAGQQSTVEDVDADNGKAENDAGEKNTEENSGTEKESTGTDITVNETDAASSDILVVYFSCTGTTKGLAENIAAELGVDLYEIVPEQPYTDDDLNYNDSNSRSTKEMEDTACRPVISGTVENMEQYDTIILGYPIWHGQAPRIVSTFVESYDFSGKTVVCFCTSGSSGIGSSASVLEEQAGSGTWMEGKRFDSAASGEEMVSGLGLK